MKCLWLHCEGGKQNRKRLGGTRNFFLFKDQRRNRGGTGFVGWIGDTGLLTMAVFPFSYLSSLVFTAAPSFRGVEVWEKGIGGKFVVVCCFVCQGCFDWAFMPALSKALLPRDMQLEIDRWEDRERQTAGDTGTDYREAKGTRCRMPVPCKILFYLQKLFRNGEKRSFSPTDTSAMVVFYKSLPQG